MQEIVGIREREFTIDFVTSNDAETDWPANVQNVLADDGFLFQERIVAPPSQIQRIKDKARSYNDGMRCTKPMFFSCAEKLPVQYSGLVVKPVAGKSVVHKLPHGLFLNSNGVSMLFSSPILSGPEPDTESFHLAFTRISDILAMAGMKEYDITRTWLYMHNLLDHYEFLNSARERYFTQWNATGNTFIPASTGIQGRLCPKAPLTIDFCAFAGERVAISQLRSPLQNEPTEYGKLFSRGVCVTLPRNKLLFVSGTASINEQGESVFHGDIQEQAKQTLRVVEAMLAEQKCDFSSVLQAVIYIKHKKDLEVCWEVIEQSGFPCNRALLLVDTDVCRDELLFEIELVASRLWRELC